MSDIPHTVVGNVQKPTLKETIPTTVIYDGREKIENISEHIRETTMAPSIKNVTALMLEG